MAEHHVVAPFPGVFYRRPSPEEDPFVVEGQQVDDDDTVCLVEVMKQFHHIRSGATGTLVRFLVENEDAVAAGQQLATIELDGQL